MSDFRVILLEGLFYELNGLLRVEEDDGVHTSVTDALAPVVGSQVLFVLHHLPRDGVDPAFVGAGSCRYPGGRGCPAGHERQPDRLLTFRQEGILRQEPWRLERSHEHPVTLPLRGMPGHYGRLAVTTVVNLAELREKLTSLGASAVSGMSVEELRSMLERLKKAAGTT